MKIKNYSKKLISMLMALVICLSAFPITSFAAYITDMNSNAQFGVVSGSYEKYGHEMHYAKYDGRTYLTFCCQWGVKSPDGSTYEYGSDFRTYVNNYGNTYDQIAKYVAFGYTMQYGDGLPSTKSEWIAACCTQQYVWETLGVNPSRSSWNDTYMNDSLFREWKAETDRLINIYYNTRPSFNNSTKSINLGSSATLTDSNGVFKYYPTFNKTINGVTFKHTNGENKLNISVADNCSTHSVNFRSASHGIYMNIPSGSGYNKNTMNYVYFEFDSGNVQDLIFSNYVDPQFFSININIEFGNLKISKSSEDEIIKNIPFTVKGNGKTYNIKTDANGNAELKNIPVGTYQIYEGDILRYVKQAVKSVTVTNGNTANVSFKNELKKGNIKIQKNSEDKIVRDFTFKVNGSDGSTYSAKTNGDGIATITDVPVYDSNNQKIVYTVQETNIPVRYVTPDGQTVTLEADKTSTVTFNNILKKFRVTVVKSDIEKGKAQGDAKLSGAKYGIFKGEQLIDTYFTDENASFTTDYYICDTDWTIREIESSEGYLVNDEIYKVGADPELYEVEYNTTANDVFEMPIKNRISIIKHSDDGSSKIETPEVNAEFQVYLKSSGSYDKADPDERDMLVTDKFGFAITKLLPYGTYTVHQVKGTEGTEYIADFDVFIDSEEKEYKYLINDPYFYSFLKVVKTDTETGKQIAYAGAGFEIYKPNGEKVEMTYTYPTPTTINTFYTNSEGYLVTPEKLIYGKGYKLVEVQSPYGYVCDSTPISFDITQEHSTKENALTIVKVERPNLAQKGVIEITKEGEIFSSVGVLGGGYIDENGNEVTFPITYSPIYETKNLANAVFQIYAAEDITTLDGTVRAVKSELVDEITTTENGAKSKELYLGKYTVIEKTAPDTFVNANEQYDIELTYAGQDVKVTSTALSVYNERQKVSVSLLKELSQDERFKLGMNNEILSVQFGIYANEDITTADGSVIPADSLITYGNCDENGKLVFNCDLPIGFKWYAKEMATDNHYILSDTKHEFDTFYKGQETEVININLNNGEPIINEFIYGTIKGLKIDRETEKTIEGALFGLFNSDETEFTEDKAILTALSDKDGIFTFENIPYGNWIVKELQPAENYLPSDDIHHITVTDNEQIIEIIAVNDRIPELKTTATVDGEKEICATETFTLVDTVEYQHLIPNKEYILKGVLMDKNSGKALVINGETVTAETIFIPTEPNGTATVEFIFDAKYIKADTDIVVFENLYKDGKELAVHADINDEGQTITVKVPEIKTTAKANGKKEITAKGEITIDDTVKYTNLTPGKEYTIVGTLMDKTTGKAFEIDGKPVTNEVTFIPEKSSGKVTVSFTFDASAIKETTELVVFETLYRDNVEIAVHADIDDEGQTVKINVPAPKTPKTGDDRNYSFWIGLGFIAIGGAISAVILKIKAKKDEDED